MSEEKDSHKEKDAKKDYDLLKEKHGLAELEELDREFVLGQLEPGKFLLRSILFKIQERCDFALKILNDIIQPENHLANMQESERFSDNDRKKVLELMRKLSYGEKELLLMEFNYSEEGAAALIKRFYSDWIAVKPELLNVLERLRDTWKGDSESRQEYGYFG
ncbi:hypothetical protein JW826_05030 [Candidatus Woesearchaeota archaeon]|nr:hypothetical protein [Candidatus Woesearchaeota archaeon]